MLESLGGCLTELCTSDFFLSASFDILGSLSNSRVFSSICQAYENTPV